MEKEIIREESNEILSEKQFKITLFKTKLKYKETNLYFLTLQIKIRSMISNCNQEKFLICNFTNK